MRSPLAANPSCWSALKANYLVELEEMARWEERRPRSFLHSDSGTCCRNGKSMRSPNRSKAAKTHEQRVEWVDQLMKQIQQETRNGWVPTTIRRRRQQRMLNPLVIPFTLNECGQHRRSRRMSELDSNKPSN